MFFCHSFFGQEGRIPISKTFHAIFRIKFHFFLFIYKPAYAWLCVRGKCVWSGVAPSLGRTEVLALLAAFSGTEIGGGWPEPPVGPSQHCVSPPPQCLHQWSAGKAQESTPSGCQSHRFRHGLHDPIKCWLRVTVYKRLFSDAHIFIRG